MARCSISAADSGRSADVADSCVGATRAGNSLQAWWLQHCISSPANVLGVRPPAPKAKSRYHFGLVSSIRSGADSPTPVDFNFFCTYARRIFWTAIAFEA